MEKREIATLPLAPIYKTRLHTGGYRTVYDLINKDADQLSKAVGLNIQDCENILQVVENCKSCTYRSRSALQIFQKEESTASIMTFSEKLDVALGGGIRSGMLTEICGVPGVGKTQLCLQLSCDVQIPAIFGGLEGEVVYIDTEGGFITDRVTDLVTATVRHCQFIASGENDKNVQTTVSAMTVEKLLAGIHVYSCHDNSQLLAVVSLLPDLLNQNQKIKLVIIDSIAFHFRHDFEDMSLRTRILTNLAQTLIATARKYDIAVMGHSDKASPPIGNFLHYDFLKAHYPRSIFLFSAVWTLGRYGDTAVRAVVTNQMTTRVHKGTDAGSHLVPCLGESWGHACTTRIILEYDRDRRLAWLYKSPCQPQAKVPYQITKDGIRDVIEAAVQQNDNAETYSDSTVQNPAKRQKLL